MMRSPLARRLLALAALGFILGGCSSSNSGSASSPSTTINGMAIAGAVTGTVTVRNGTGTTLASAPVTAGAFSVSLPDTALAGELEFVVVGTYADEMSAAMVNLSANYPLALRTAAGHFTAGQTGNAPVTPDTTVIRNLVANHGQTLAQAQVAFQNAFGYQLDLSAVPFDPVTTDSTMAAARSQADRDASFRAGAMSALAANLGLTGDAIAELPAALARDLADGDLDGHDGSNPVTIAAVNLRALHGADGMPFRQLKSYSGFAGAEVNHDHAQLSAPASGFPTLAYDSAGVSKTVTTAKGRHVTVTLDTVADAPFDAGFYTARVRHRLTLVDADTLQPININSDPDIVSVSNHPMMYMLSGHDHTTPHGHDPDLAGVTSGQYVLDNYYVMASTMGNGTPMGVWDYVFFINEDSDGVRTTAEHTTEVIFHPRVNMTMGGKVLAAAASHANDQWTNMEGVTQTRPYRVWLHAVDANAGGGHDLALFVSTQNIANPAPGSDPHAHTLSFPSVYAGRALQGPVDAVSGVRPDVALTSVTVEVSTDGGTSWQALAADGTSGRYAGVQIPGLSAGSAASVQVRLTVNGNVMATAAGAMPQLQFTAP
jgi:hypothetical protein